MRVIEIQNLRKGDIIIEDCYPDHYEVMEVPQHINNTVRCGWEVKLKNLRNGLPDQFFCSDVAPSYGPCVILIERPNEE